MTISYPELAAIRLGYGLSPLIPPPRDPEAVLADVAATAALAPSVTEAEAEAAAVRYVELNREVPKKAAGAGMGPKESEAFRSFRRELVALRDGWLRTRLAACAGAPVGFGERLVQFWFDHFTVKPKGVPANPMVVAYLEGAIRPNIAGSFADLLIAADTHPAMLLFLDQARSVGEMSRFARDAKKPVGVNENLARELLELHTLGVGAGYSQTDVRQLAYLLTGLGYEPGRAERFLPRRAQPGAETVLGVTYGGAGKGDLADILQAMRDIAARPETAAYVSRKLAVHFVSDTPDEGLVAALTAAWGEAGDLPALYRVLVTHPALATQFRQKVRQPFDFLAAGLRALGLTGEAILALDDKAARRLLMEPLALMGQPWLDPTGPDGWAEAGEAWVNPQLLAARIDWAMNAPKALRDPLPDPRGFVQAALGGTATEALAWAVPKAESDRDGVGVVLASNDFNRR